MSEHRISFKLNGEHMTVSVRGRERLIDVLRRLGMKSVKEGCSVGDCGTCIVLLDGEPINSCLMLAVQARDREITTLEGLSRGGELHPLQRAFIELAASQCGFCIPGIIMTAKGLLDRVPQPTEDEVRHALVGNLCRCTGYAKIIAAIRSAAQRRGPE